METSGAPPHPHLLAVRASVTNIGVTDRVVLQVSPQAYVLRTNCDNGTYVNASLSWGLRGSPVSIGTMINVPVRTGVTGGDDILWNVGPT